MKVFRYLAMALIVAIAPVNAFGQDTPSHAIIAWNQTVLAIAEEEDKFLTLKGLRTATMMHLAMHDAINSVDGKFTPYLYHEPHSKANAFVAINQAAYRVAVEHYPDKKMKLEQLRDKWISKSKDEGSVDKGMRLGEEVARLILKARTNDGWDTEAAYQWHPMAPGVYAEFNEHSGTPEGFVFGAGWAQARPFGLESNDSFTSPAPPEITSDAYTRAFQEVKDLGASTSKSRTADQTHLALWWKDFVENSHNRLARMLVEQEGVDLHRSIRLFALLNMSIYDAYISSFHNKFLYNHWRPYTAIRWAAHDENVHTNPDTSWTNTHQHTYAFPSYPSAHGTACAAATMVLADVFGDAYPYTMYTEEVDEAGPFSNKIKMDPPTRSFNSFHEAALECALSRVFLGIHFSYDSLEGVHLGRRVGAYNVKNHLTSK